MVNAHMTAEANHELVDVLTAISKVSMRLAVKLEMLGNAMPADERVGGRNTGKGGYPHEAVRSESGNRRPDFQTRPRP